MPVSFFLSCVTAEFGALREPLRQALTRPNVAIQVQEDFIGYADDTLAMLEDYIAKCDGVVHFIGEQPGWTPPPVCVERLLQRRPDLEARLAPLTRADLDGLSATQWEAWLAIALGRSLLLVSPAPGTIDGAAQKFHLERLQALGRYPKHFTDAKDVVVLALRSSIYDALVAAGREAPPGQPNNLPFATLGDLFKGRDEFLETLRTALRENRGAAVAGRAVHGLGGVGKTRLAIEYAFRHAAEYSALLFVGAASASLLEKNLATLAGVLGLKESEAREDSVKIEAALDWLRAHPTWLLILDNIDDDDASRALAAYLPKLSGGHLLLTGRLGNYPAGIRRLPLDVLDEAPAAAFLLQRTENRPRAADDEARARELAGELGYLALGLEQAGAYIDHDRIGFARYLALWRERREQVLTWFRPDLMNYPAALATTWVASVERLLPESRRLLERLAFLAPEPVPDFLLDVKAKGDDLDPRAALPGLYGYSLAAPATYDDGKLRVDGFSVHRLVQDFLRRATPEPRRGEALREALAWVDAGFQGQADDVRNWPRLDPLEAHALAVAGFGDAAGIAEPTGRLFGNLGVLYSGKARHRDQERVKRRALEIGEASLPPDAPELATRLNNLAYMLNQTNRSREAEPLYRRALAIDEASYGPDHPEVATDLNNLAVLLRATGRYAEAEPLYRRALAIDEASYGPDHPAVAIGLNNLAGLLRDTNRAAGAEPLYRRALAIHEASYGPDHPNVAIRLNNLALLLEATNRAAEAEPLYRRALAIDEASYGPDHPNVATGLVNLGALLRDTGRVDEAAPMLRRAATIFEASYGPEHPHTKTARAHLARLDAAPRPTPPPDAARGGGWLQRAVAGVQGWRTKRRAP